MMQFFLGQVIFSILVINEAVSMAVRSPRYAPRSVPGRLKASSDPLSIKDYFLNYLASERRNEQPQYGLPEYQPTYNHNPFYRKQISPEAVAALIPYLTNSKDYNSYDYNQTPDTSDDPSWYEDSYQNDFTNTADRSSQDAALFQLYLDQLRNKYSLEDLETLEREAAIEDNNENQLQALMPKKQETTMPVFNYIPTSVHSEPIPFRQGQKEEVLMLPATAIRRPVFARSSAKPQNQKEKKSVKILAPLPAETKKMEKSNQISLKQNTKAATSATEPRVTAAYNSLRKYLDRERMTRQNADEQDFSHRQHKRFISQPKELLSEQLISLKRVS